MALTPEDVVNKRFAQTKFREGYDQDEVDDFLDEVVVELRRLTQENEELKAKLEGRAPVAAVEAKPVAAAAAVAAPVVAAAVVDVEDESASTTNLLQLARRLHDEHVREGIEKRDSLISEGNATAARIVAEAEATQRSELARLNKEKSGIEHRIDELRTFEKEYRTKLRSYIEGQLNDLDTNSGAESTATAASGHSGFGS
jgi:DivIVA domain-containing protein